MRELITGNTVTWYKTQQKKTDAHKIFFYLLFKLFEVFGKDMFENFIPRFKRSAADTGTCCPVKNNNNNNNNAYLLNIDIQCTGYHSKRLKWKTYNNTVLHIIIILHISDQILMSFKKFQFQWL